MFSLKTVTVKFIERNTKVCIYQIQSLVYVIFRWSFFLCIIRNNMLLCFTSHLKQDTTEITLKFTVLFRKLPIKLKTVA